MKILLIEDSADQAKLLAKLFQKITQSTSLELLHASNLTDGLRLSVEAKPDVTFLDLGIPLLQGGQILPWRQVAEHISQFIPPVIIVTGLDVNANDFEIKFECIRQGAQRVFEKPFAEKLLSWVWSNNPAEVFAERLLDAAGAAHLRHVLTNGKQNGRS